MKKIILFVILFIVLIIFSQAEAGNFLKQNTATRITVGPFVDKGDFITPEVALTVTNCHLTLIVDTGGVPTLVLDANATASGGDNDMVHITGDDAGYYDLELTAAQTNYVGRAKLSINDVANHAPVFHEFEILPANTYDSLIAGTDNLVADVKEWNGSNVATPDTAGYPKVTIKDGTGQGEINLTSGKIDEVSTLTGHTAQTGDAYAIVNNGTFGNSALNTDLDTLLTRLSATRAGYLDNLTYLTGDAYSLLNTAAGEPGQGAPNVSLSPVDKIRWLYKFMRNKITQTATEQKVYDDAGTTVDHKSTVSDNGTTFTRDKFISGAP